MGGKPTLKTRIEKAKIFGRMASRTVLPAEEPYIDISGNYVYQSDDDVYVCSDGESEMRLYIANDNGVHYWVLGTAGNDPRLYAHADDQADPCLAEWYHFAGEERQANVTLKFKEKRRRLANQCLIDRLLRAESFF